ncbi:TonB C-terminal domain-containing protein [bacterium]|nr:TonB C-terminal domain-containing protein [bacterium]
MFRCKECGSEFDIKPDYCDCGNDTFDEIIEKVETPVEKEPVKEEKSINFFETKKLEHDIPKLDPKQEKQKSEPVIKFEKPNIPQIKIEPISLTIFLICLLLSVLVIFFVGNPKEDSVSNKNIEKTQTTNKNIPPIDKIWDNTLPAKAVADSQQSTVKEEPIDQQQIQISQPVEVKKNENKVVQPIQQKPVINNQKQTKPIQTQPIQSQQKQQTKPQQPVKSSTSQQVKNVISQTKPAPVQQVKTVNPQEMINYKIALRNKLASKIDFTSILGDGTCVISFKISQSGTLTNRSFVKQSDNGILNDIVYNAIMSTPVFNSPPSSYNNETLKFTVKMYDGRYEVSLN